MPAEPKRIKPGQLPKQVTTADLAVLLGITAMRVKQLVAEGVVPRAAPGRFDLAEAVQAYIKYKSGLAERQTQTKSADALRDQRAEEIALRNEARKRSLIPLTEAVEAVEKVTGAFLAAVSGLPARITRVPRERERIEAICDEERLRLTDLFAEQGKALRTGVGTAEADLEDDA